MVLAPEIRTQIGPLLRLGLPLMGGQLAQASIQIVDTLMLGRYDVQVLAGVVLANAMFFSLLIFGSGFAWAVTPLVAAAAAQGDTVRVRRVARMGFWASLAFSMLAVPVLLWGEALLLRMGEPPDLAAIAGDYFEIAAWGMVPALAVMLLRSHLAALHRTQIVLWVTLAASVMNAGLNWVLIFGNLGLPEMGAHGAALASVLMQTGSVVALALYAQRMFPEQELFVRMWRPDWAELRQVVHLGLPIGVANIAEAGLFSAAAVMVGWIGIVELAAHGIALQMATVTFMMHVGLSQAATVLAGGAYARRDWSGLRNLSIAALLISGAISVVAIVGMLSFPRTLILLFLDGSDPQAGMILTAGIGLVAVAAVFQGADGAQVVLISLLRGVQDTRVPMILATVSYWGVGAPLGYVFGVLLGHGAAGVWMGLVGGLFCAALLLFRRFWLIKMPEFVCGAA